MDLRQTLGTYDRDRPYSCRGSRAHPLAHWTWSYPPSAPARILACLDRHYIRGLYCSADRLSPREVTCRQPWRDLRSRRVLELLSHGVSIWILLSSDRNLSCRRANLHVDHRRDWRYCSRMDTLSPSSPHFPLSCFTSHPPLLSCRDSWPREPSTRGRCAACG